MQLSLGEIDSSIISTKLGHRSIEPRTSLSFEDLKVAFQASVMKSSSSSRHRDWCNRSESMAITEGTWTGALIVGFVVGTRAWVGLGGLGYAEVFAVVHELPKFQGLLDVAFHRLRRP
jgi:hypothetical protein